MRLKDKVALITGSGSGMGRAASILFAEEGAKVVVAEVGAEAGQETVRLVKGRGGDAIFVKTDVTKASDARAAVEAAVKSYGKLNVLYNNAGIEGSQAELKDTSEADFDRTIAVNLKGVFLVSKSAIPEMIKAGGGSIINTASTFAHIGAPLFGPYCASKTGILGLTRVMALELARYNIRVNAICPAAIVTPMHARYLGGKGTEAEKRRIAEVLYENPKLGELFTGTEAEKMHLSKHPIGRFASPMEVARVALFLASDESSYVTGSSVFVDGGYTAI